MNKFQEKSHPTDEFNYFSGNSLVSHHMYYSTINF